MRNELEKTFKHHSWFVGAKKTIAEALDYFAKTGDFYINRKLTYNSFSLMDDSSTETFTLHYSGKERGSYKLSDAEHKYYKQRVEYWKQEKQRQNETTLNNPVNFQEEIGKWISSNSLFSTWYSKQNIANWMEYPENNPDRIECIPHWEERIKMQETNLSILKEHIDMYGSEVKTLRDFRQFETNLYSCIEKAHNRTIHDLCCN